MIYGVTNFIINTTDHPSQGWGIWILYLSFHIFPSLLPTSLSFGVFFIVVPLNKCIFMVWGFTYFTCGERCPYLSELKRNWMEAVSQWLGVDVMCFRCCFSGCCICSPSTYCLKRKDTRAEDVGLQQIFPRTQIGQFLLLATWDCLCYRQMEFETYIFHIVLPRLLWLRTTKSKLNAWVKSDTKKRGNAWIRGWE